MTTRPKLSSLIRESLPTETSPVLTEEQIERLKTAGAVTLAVLGVVGTIALSAVAPNIFYALDKIFTRKPRNRNNWRKEKEAKIRRSFYYLKSHNYIIMKPTLNDFTVTLTRLGRLKLKKLNFETLMIPKPNKWNKKWWIVAADIPTEDYKWAADLFRQKLKDMKFFSLQRTLWCYPFDPRREIEYIINHYGIGQFVTVMEADRLDFDDERKMIDYFNEEKIL